MIEWHFDTYICQAFLQRSNYLELDESSSFQNLLHLLIALGPTKLTTQTLDWPPQGT